MNKYKRLFGNSLLFAVGNLGSKLINILMVPLYTYQLTTSQYGTIDIMLTTINLLVPILTLELGQAAIRFAIDSKSEDEKFHIYYNIMRFSILLGTVILLTYPFFRYMNVFGDYLLAFMFVLILSQTNQILSQFVRGAGYVKAFAFNGIIQTLVTVFSNIFFLVVLDFKINGYLYSMILANFISCLYLFSISKGFKLFRINNTKSAKLLKNMFVYSTPLIPNTTMWWLINGATRYFILFFISSAANGIYAVASKIPSIISMVGSIFIQAWQISAFEEYDSKDRDAFNSSIFNLYYVLLFTISSAILVVLIPMMNVVVSADYFESWKLVPLLLLGVTYQNLSGFLGVNYTASRKTKGAFTTSIYGGVAAVLSNIIFIPILGLMGASISSAVSFFLMWLIRLIDTKKYSVISVNWIPFILTNIIFLIQIGVLFLGQGAIMIFMETCLFVIMLMVNLPHVFSVLKKFTQFRKTK